MALYELPPDLHPMLSMTGATGRAQIALLHSGPGLIVPDMLHGSLIGFPSYHCELALLVGWHAWELKSLRWPLVLLNAIIIVSTPSQGGHHLMDVLGAVLVTALALLMTRDRNARQLFHQMPVPKDVPIDGLPAAVARSLQAAAPRS
jgi:membrane-associated phospholipid phosphatase